MPASIIQMISTTSKMSLMRLHKGTISMQFWGRHAQILHRAKRMVDLVAVKLAHWDGVLRQLCLILMALW